MGFGNRLVGVTTYCDYPAEAQKLPKIGGFMSPSLEAIAAKRPDFVIGVSSATDPVKAREMERLGLKVTLISLASVSDILNSIKSIARLLGDPEAGEKLVDKITRQFDEVKKRVASAPRRSHSIGRGASAAGRSWRQKFYRRADLLWPAVKISPATPLNPGSIYLMNTSSPKRRK